MVQIILLQLPNVSNMERQYLYRFRFQSGLCSVHHLCSLIVDYDRKSCILSTSGRDKIYKTGVHGFT